MANYFESESPYSLGKMEGFKFQMLIRYFLGTLKRYPYVLVEAISGQMAPLIYMDTFLCLSLSLPSIIRPLLRRLGGPVYSE